MRIVLFALLIISLTTCNYIQTKIPCACCERTYSSIDSALTCGSDPANYKSLLFAFVNSDVEKNQKKGWAILEDPDIIEIAKRDYVLIILDPKHINLSRYKDINEFQDLLKPQRQETFFVVTNRVLYPFRDFTLKTSKDKILSDLGIGEGP